jgi:hypothetical protein
MDDGVWQWDKSGLLYDVYVSLVLAARGRREQRQQISLATLSIGGAGNSNSNSCAVPSPPTAVQDARAAAIIGTFLQHLEARDTARRVEIERHHYRPFTLIPIAATVACTTSAL